MEKQKKLDNLNAEKSSAEKELERLKNLKRI